MRPEINSPTEIRTIDLSNLKIEDYSLISDKYLKLCEETQVVGDNLRRKLGFYRLFKDTLPINSINEKTNEIITLFDKLKTQQEDGIHIFNKLNQLNNTIEKDVFKYNDKTRFLSNLNSVQKLLEESRNIIPEYNLNLDSLPDLNIGDYISSEIEQSTSIVKNLNEEVQKT